MGIFLHNDVKKSDFFTLHLNDFIFEEEEECEIKFPLLCKSKYWFRFLVFKVVAEEAIKYKPKKQLSFL